ncbi:MAG TPA: hypothetical protein DDW52_15480 [Planctomycetaceae bacterium]|nr:hypothetical protein [Planctomycetaceae bacterium]
MNVLAVPLALVQFAEPNLQTHAQQFGRGMSRRPEAEIRPAAISGRSCVGSNHLTFDFATVP